MSGTPGRVDVRRQGSVGHLTLDRPEAINALSLPMLRRAQAVLDGWRDDPRVSTVLLDGRGERGFCAGGDLKYVHRAILEDSSRVLELWQAQCRLDVTIAEYPKPVVTVADGITMGGGMGMASHASHRVVTERSRLGMPEVGLGLAPDVGGLFLLARAPGRTGTHAALTGVTLNAADALAMGLADYALPRADLGRLAGELDGADPTAVLARLHAPAAAGPVDLLAQRSWIDDAYASCEDLPTLLKVLRDHPDPRARATSQVLLAGAPTALAVTWEALRRAAGMTRVRECFVQDYRVSSRFLGHPDFLEGIRARIIDRDQRPRWSPDDLGAVGPEDVERFFAPLEHDLVLD